MTQSTLDRRDLSTVQHLFNFLSREPNKKLAQIICPIMTGLNLDPASALTDDILSQIMNIVQTQVVPTSIPSELIIVLIGGPVNAAVEALSEVLDRLFSPSDGENAYWFLWELMVQA
jgi:hypothetical protein